MTDSQDKNTALHGSGAGFRLVLLTDGLRSCELIPLATLGEIETVGVSVVTWSRKREADEYHGEAGVGLPTLDCSRGAPWPFRSALRSRRVLRSLVQPFDLAILRADPFSGTLRSVIRDLNRRGVRWCYWGESPFAAPGMGLPKRIFRAYLRHILQSAWAILGVGSSACENWRSIFGDSVRIHNLPYVPALQSLWEPGPETLAAAKCIREGWKDPLPVIALCAGELTRGNAHDTALEAFLSLHQAIPNLCLIFAGDGGLRSSLESKVRRSGLEHRVRFLPSDPLGRDAACLAADFAILPARAYKPWGSPIHRALAAGLPVVVSDRVGCRDDLVDDGRTGFVVPAKQIDALTAAMRQLAQEEPQRRRMARRAVAKARQYDASRVAQRLFDFMQAPAGL